MRTDTTIPSSAAVAIRAKNLIPAWEAFFSKPPVEMAALTTESGPVFIPATVDVVYGQEEWLRLAAAPAIRPVMFADFAGEFVGVALPGCGSRMGAVAAVLAAPLARLKAILEWPPAPAQSSSSVLVESLFHLGTLDGRIFVGHRVEYTT